MNLFASVEARGVARDIFLDGNTFRDSQSINKKPVVADGRLGAVAVLGATQLSFTHVFQMRGFDGQPHPDQFGSLSLSIGL